MDLISREEALKVFGNIHSLDYNAQAYKSKIEKIPTIESRPDGKWIQKKCEYLEHDISCSECGFTVYVKTQWKYCPNCGSEMEAE